MVNASVFSDTLKTLSVILGADEAALRLLISILGGYPLAIFYRKFIYGRGKNLQHIFFIFTGFLLGYLNYGSDVVHLFVTMGCTYAILVALGGTVAAVAAVFIFSMLYLSIGYYIMSTDSYDINWTMPHCVLTLRLIGIAFDYMDGQQNEESLGADGKKYMLKTLPNVLEFLGFASFPTTLLVGPQFPMKRYQSFVNGDFGDPNNPSKPPSSESSAFNRFGMGFFYLMLYQFLGLFVSDAFLLSQDFKDFSFMRKHLLLGLWGRFTLYKYISCWLLAEGSCILFGITYNGTDQSGKKLWNGLENVKLARFESATQFNHYIQSFNINTNHWVAHYIYKRLKFLGNRHLSQAGALLFLAVWHGYHSGYFVCFLCEFLVIYVERDISSIIKSSEKLTQIFDQALVDIAVKLLLRLYTFVFMGFCLVPFVLLNLEKYWEVYISINYSGVVLFFYIRFYGGP
ncbi:hypothetical protein HHI36_021013 [Cryptolaemus montrouzieri]|uniref:Lysophospholipid acyltransferase 5 n=1 Tax=Cryptolaemus montrouzieri TaxID=559131 RepID=A0ABD2MVN6_9CUCU